ncbi:MAG: DUF5752 family protein, partial [Chloroflexota bacterium]|nr:DUF5752 family protein [Chloroflexota bacterium]
MADRWIELAIPLAVFLAGIIAALWLRGAAYRALDRWTRKTRWQGDEILLQATRSPSILWSLVLSAYLALAVSTIHAVWKDLAGKALWSLLIVSFALTALSLANRFIPLYGEKWQLPHGALRLGRNVARIAILIIAGLTLLDIWGAPTSPILVLMAITALAVLLAFRGSLSNLFGWYQLSASGSVKIGDYIKLETGEEGYVIAIDWMNTKLEALDQSIVAVPNSKLISSTVTNYGRPLKKAKEPFHFYSRVHLKELTGLRAKDLQELANILKTAPDSVVYYHTHQFLEEHQYLTPEPANDFALWVRDALGDEALGERLAALDTFEFNTLGTLRDRLVSIIEEHLALALHHPDQHRVAVEGREFHFIKSVSVVSPTPYLAH